MKFFLPSLVEAAHVLRRVFVVSLLSVAVWGRAAAAAPPAALETVFLYASPITAAFFRENGTNYDSLTGRWREYLRPLGKRYQEVSRASLLLGLEPGVLVLASAVLLDEQERQAINAFAAAGGSVLVTWGSGARDGTGRWTGYGFIESLLQMKVTGKVMYQDSQRFINPFGDGPLTWGVPGGERIFLGEVAETPLRVASDHLAARYFDWARYPAAKTTNGAVAFLEKGASRRVYLGFSESSWEYDNRAELPKMLNSVMAWLQHQPRIYKSAWPSGRLSAQLLEMDTEDKYANALNFAHELDGANIRGTFYSLTGVAIKHRDVVRKLAEKHEIGYHAEVHVGFKGKTPEAQQARLNAMVSGMTDILGSRALATVSGFRAPTESWDATTEKLLRPLGIRHHVADPGSSDARIPFFSRSEPGLSAEQALVVLPRTQMDDLNYLGMKLSTEKSGELIMRDFEYGHEAGALGVLSVHSQSYGRDGLMSKLTPPYVKRLQDHRDDVWAVSGGQIESWWRQRERVIHEPNKGNDTRLVFDVRAPGQVTGLSFFVTHAVAGKGPTEVLPAGANAPQPTITRIDAYRSALVFPQTLPVGRYSYDLLFQ